MTQNTSNYFSTGYDLRVPLMPGVSYVNVVAPNGNTLTLLRGSDGMVLPKPTSPSSPSGTTFIRLASAYQAASGAPASHPSNYESSLVFVPSDLTDTQLTQIPNQGVWTFSYYSGSYTMSGQVATGGTLLATQYYKTRTRANTLAELKTQVWASLKASSVTDMVNRFQTNTGTTSSYASLPAANNLSVDWDVPAGALPPTQIKLFGNALYFDYTSNTTKAGNAGFTSTTNVVSYASGRTPFNDNQNVGSTARAGTIACANGAIDVNNMGEKHCANPGYLTTARQTGLHLWARDPSGREYAHFYAPYTLQ